MNQNINNNIAYAGVYDTKTDLFEGQYPIPEGISYNSYVVCGDKTAIIDTVDAKMADEWAANIAKALDGRTPDYLVVQHVEPDHSGCIAQIMKQYPQLQVVGNAKTFAFINQFYHIEDLDARKIVVKEADVLDLGNMQLSFVMAPMVHWPEVMVSYERTTKTLFSADAFGTFGNPDGTDGWDDEARRYYINICGKYGVQVQNLLKKAAALDIEAICPLHGPVLRENIGHCVQLYTTWSSYTPETEGVLVAYASIHGNTAKAARELADAIAARGTKAKAMDLARTDLSYAVAEAFRFDRMVLAASSYDGGVFPRMEDFINHLKAKTYQNRTVALVENGSWAPSAAKTMRAALETFKNISIIEPVVTIKSSADAAAQAQMQQMTDALLNK